MFDVANNLPPVPIEQVVQVVLTHEILNIGDPSYCLVRTVLLNVSGFVAVDAKLWDASVVDFDLSSQHWEKLRDTL